MNRFAVMNQVRTRGLYRTRSVSPLAMRQSLGCYGCAPRAGFGALGASAKATGAAGGAATGAQVGSVVPGIGTAVGAVVGAVAGALFSKKKDPNAAEKAALKGQLDDYQKVQGQIPGRAFSLLQLKQLIDGAGQKGMWPNVKKWSGDAIAGAIDGCKGCTPPTIPAWVKAQVEAGQLDPRELADAWTQHVNATWGSKWMVATAGATQRQLIVDLMDYYIGLYKPDAPLFYAQSWSVGAQPAAPVQSGASPSVSTGSITPSAGPGAQFSQAGFSPEGIPLWKGLDGKLYVWDGKTVSLYSGPLTTPTAPGTSVVSVTPIAPPRVSSASDPNLQAYIQALMAQGQSQQQAFNAAMSALQNSGVQATPQAQQTVAAEVQQAGAGAGLPPWMLYVAGGAALMFALARPARGRK